MKKMLFSLFAVLSLAAPSFAAEPQAQLLSDAAIRAIYTAAPYDLINWKVGDSAEYKVTLSGLPFGGTMKKEATKEEDHGIWVHQDIDLMIQKDSSDLLINRADGKVLKFIHNGKEEQLPDDKIEIVSQDDQEVTVPAGKFEAIHIVAKSQQVPKIEAWINPRDTVMDGTIKEIINNGQMDITMELASFKRN